MIYIVYVYIVWSAVAEFLIKNAGGSGAVLSLIDEILVLMILVHLILTQAFPAAKQPRMIETYVWVLIAISAVSFLVNQAYPVNTLQFLLSIFKPVILYFWVRKNITDGKLERFMLTFLAFLIVLQIPFFIYGFASMRMYYIGDNATGATITGDAHQVGIYMWVGTIFSFLYFFMTKKIRYLFFALATSTMLLITSTKQIIFLLPIVLFYLLRKELKMTLMKTAVFALVIGGALLGVYLAVERSFTELQWDADYEESNLRTYVENSEKIQGYYSAIYELPDESSFSYLLGAGPGMYGSSTAMSSRTPLAEKYIMYYNDLILPGEEGTLTYRSSGIIAIYGDLGLLSLIIFLGMYARVIRENINAANVAKDIINKSVMLLAAASGILILSESFLQNIFEGNWFVLNYFWILSGSIAARKKDSRFTDVKVKAR